MSAMAICAAMGQATAMGLAMDMGQATAAARDRGTAMAWDSATAMGMARVGGSMLNMSFDMSIAVAT